MFLKEDVYKYRSFQIMKFWIFLIKKWKFVASVLKLKEGLILKKNYTFQAKIAVILIVLKQ